MVVQREDQVLGGAASSGRLLLPRGAKRPRPTGPRSRLHPAPSSARHAPASCLVTSLLRTLPPSPAVSPGAGPRRCTVSTTQGRTTT